MLGFAEVEEIVKSSYTSHGGIGRCVYPISEDVIMKVPHNLFDQEGIDQTYAEIDFYKWYFEDYSDLMCKMLYVLEVPRFNVATNTSNSLTCPVLFMERVSPLVHAVELRDFLGVTEAYYSSIIDFIHKWYPREQATEKANQVIDFIAETNLEDAWSNFSNWGITKEGHLVIIDCGMHGEREEYW